MSLKRTTPKGIDRPEIMYVCEWCAENAPEGCGHTDPSEIRRAPDGAWLCEDCWDNSDGRTDALFSDLPQAPAAYRHLKPGDV